MKVTLELVQENAEASSYQERIETISRIVRAALTTHKEADQ